MLHTGDTLHFYRVRNSTRRKASPAATASPVSTHHVDGVGFYLLPTTGDIGENFGSAINEDGGYSGTAKLTGTQTIVLSSSGGSMTYSMLQQA